MAQRRLEDLARLYNLAARIHALDPVKAAFRAYIKSTGLALIMDEEKVRAHGHMQSVCLRYPILLPKLPVWAAPTGAHADCPPPKPQNPKNLNATSSPCRTRRW